MELSLGKRRHEGAVALAKARQVDLVRALSAQGLSAGSLDSDPALQLGVALSGMLEAKADKLTVALSPGLAELADLVRAEAARCGLVPLVGEPLVDAKKYADDRVFVGARLSSEPLPAQDDKSAAKGDEHRLRRLISAGLPVIRFAADSLDAARTIFTNAFAALRAMGAPDLAGPVVEPITLVDGALPGELPALTTGTLTAYTSPLLTMMLPQIAGTLGSAAKASCAHWIAALLAMSDAGDALVLSLHGAKAEQISELAQTVREVTTMPLLASHGTSLLRAIEPLALRGKAPLICIQLVAQTAEVTEQALVRAHFAALVAAEKRVLRLEAPDTDRLADALREAASALAK